jgi:hypothetical protein
MKNQTSPRLWPGKRSSAALASASPRLRPDKSFFVNDGVRSLGGSMLLLKWMFRISDFFIEEFYDRREDDEKVF